MKREHQKFYRQVGLLIQGARAETGMTGAMLAEMVGMTRASISNMEAGRQRIAFDTMVAISRHTGVELEDLVPANPPLKPGPSIEEHIDALSTDDASFVRAVLDGEEVRSLSPNTIYDDGEY